MWAESVNCCWLGKLHLRSMVLESIENEDILPTPLSIKNFALATTKVEIISELEEIINEKSKEVEKVFAKEIKSMTYDKIVFLSYLFISGISDVNLFRIEFKDLIAGLKILRAKDFDYILNWFKDDRVNIHGDIVEFAHPSYSKSFDYLLKENGKITTLNQRIISKMIIKLSAIEQAASDVVYIVLKHYNKFPIEVQELIFILIKNKNNATSIFNNISKYYDQLPDRVHKLMFLYVKKQEYAEIIAQSLCSNFNILPKGVIYKLLLILSRKSESMETIALLVNENFLLLPVKIRNKVILNLADNEPECENLVKIIEDKYDKLLSDKILYKLAEKKESMEMVIDVISSHFNLMPRKVRNDVLSYLIKNQEIVSKLPFLIASNYSVMPLKVRQILFKLARDEKTAEEVARAIVANYDDIPSEVKDKLFFILANSESASNYFDEIGYLKNNLYYSEDSKGFYSTTIEDEDLI